MDTKEICVCGHDISRHYTYATTGYYMSMPCGDCKVSTAGGSYCFSFRPATQGTPEKYCGCACHNKKWVRGLEHETRCCEKMVGWMEGEKPPEDPKEACIGVRTDGVVCTADKYDGLHALNCPERNPKDLEPISAQIERFRKEFEIDQFPDIILRDDIEKWIEKALSTAHRNGVKEGRKEEADHYKLFPQNPYHITQ